VGRSAANEKTAASGVRADEITVRKSSGCGVVLFDRATLKRGHFERERAGIVEKLPKLAGAALSLLKCLRTPKYTRLQDFAITISQDFSGDDTPDPAKVLLMLGSRHSHCSCLQNDHCLKRHCFAKQVKMDV